MEFATLNCGNVLIEFMNLGGIRCYGQRSKHEKKHLKLKFCWNQSLMLVRIN